MKTVDQETDVPDYVLLNRRIEKLKIKEAEESQKYRRKRAAFIAGGSFVFMVGGWFLNPNVYAEFDVIPILLAAVVGGFSGRFLPVIFGYDI